MESDEGVFILKDENQLIPMQHANFVTESDFQQLLASFPALLAGNQIDSEAPRRFVLVSREQPIPSDEGGASRWSVDHLFLDQDGIPTLVEVKRHSDTRIRREVVGQMLDYAANFTAYWTAEVLRARFEACCSERGSDPAAVLAGLSDSTRTEDDYWSKVKTNLEAGRIRMLFIADRMPPELRLVVEFLNGQMEPAEVLAIELRQYQGENMRALVPLVIGQSERALQKKGAARGPKREWDEESLLQDIDRRCGDAVRRRAEILISWMKKSGGRSAVRSGTTRRFSESVL